MSAPSDVATAPHRDIEAFLQAFFGPGNDADAYPETTESFKRFARLDDGTPIVLPRFVASSQEATMYVIADNRVLAPHVSDLINAFAGPTYCKTAELVPVTLDPADPVEAAIIEHYGPAVDTYVLTAGTNPQHRRNLRNALQRMQSTVSRRPRRHWQLDKPLGRLLGEFDAALAAGGEATSAQIFSQISAKGGLTASNLAHLRIKRLDRLGLSGELLALPELSGVLLQDPPVRVREAVLNAVYQTVLAEPLARGDVTAAWENLRDLEPALPLPVHDPVSLHGGQAAAVLLVAAIGRDDHDMLVTALASRGSWSDEELPGVLWRHIERLVGVAVSPATSEQGPGVVHTATDDHQLTGWVDFITAAVQRDPRVPKVISDGSWGSWPPLAQEDARVRDLLVTLRDHEWLEVWQVVSVFIEAVGDDGVAPAISTELIGAALTLDRLSRSDLLSLYALTEIFLRSAPSRSRYADLLDGLRASASQWAGVQTSDVVLDFADRLVVAACPDESARTDTAIALLEPLHRGQRRLAREDALLAKQLCDELAVPLEWLDAPEDDAEFTLADVPPLSVLLYSLDEAVLARSADQLHKQSANIKVVTSHDKVGTDSLKQKARNADVIVLATRCAKHAATGFITENSGRNVRTVYADGSGSASLLRAAVQGIRSFVE
ncbi:DUF2325 domain-containing protein [Saccharothrix luteola]|uniref:DUF2325 domain-containing protein n=1 Tax=Saccharothrix luteola TaxID=2893018 RepID=UPI001E28A0B5|nr:DUF2325 domain-containing protein [Saccharothrix luteola]MCC8244083.1 DUF2325 domain-containing protein [Saccharothrix luteola]